MFVYYLCYKALHAVTFLFVKLSSSQGGSRIEWWLIWNISFFICAYEHTFLAQFTRYNARAGLLLPCHVKQPCAGTCAAGYVVRSWVRTSLEPRSVSPLCGQPGWAYVANSTCELESVATLTAKSKNSKDVACLHESSLDFHLTCAFIIGMRKLLFLLL